MGAVLATAPSECMSYCHQNFTNQPIHVGLTIQAAKFGRGFLDFHNPTDFVQMGQILKVLNAVHFYEVGIPLTYSQ